MVTDGQVSELRRLLAKGKSLAASARMALMDKKTARSYRDDERLPSQRTSPRQYRTRVDPFVEVWDDIEQMLRAEPRLKAKTLFENLQQQHPGEFDASTRRTFERRVAHWRAIHGPDKPAFFAQDHHPGRFAASDFTVCNELGVKIAGATFPHTLFHCVLTYSNVESVSLCFSESFEALSEGIQNAFWEFGGVPLQHRTDSLSAGTSKIASSKRYCFAVAATSSLVMSTWHWFSRSFIMPTRVVRSEAVAIKMYLQILKLAADESQQAVEDSLRVILASGAAINLDELRRQVTAAEAIPPSDRHGCRAT